MKDATIKELIMDQMHRECAAYRENEISPMEKMTEDLNKTGT